MAMVCIKYIVLSRPRQYRVIVRNNMVLDLIVMADEDPLDKPIWPHDLQSQTSPDQKIVRTKQQAILACWPEEMLIDEKH